MSDLSPIFLGFVMTLIFSVVFAVYSIGFRGLVKRLALNGIRFKCAKQLIKAQPFRKRLFMTYIWKCNSTGKQCLNLATWFLVCHYIHVISYIVIVIMIWNEVRLYYRLFGQMFSADIYVIGTLTYNNLINLTGQIFLGALPVALVIALPFLLLSEKKLDKASSGF